MRRWTSIFLALAMLLALVPANIFAAENDKTVFSDMKDSDYYAQAATALEQLDIISGYPDGTYRAENSITRAEMATIICRIIDKEDDAKKAQGENVFEDVKSEHWASGYINVAVEEEIVNGDGNGKFRPEDEVKYEEAIKMIVCALGYAEDIDVDPEDWAKAYLDVANEEGITSDLEGEEGEAATRGDIAVMVYNGLATESENSKVPATPVASLKAGEYSGTQKVKLTTVTKDSDIYYTTDGTTPTAKSTKYAKEISISQTSILKAVAVKNGVVSKNIMSVEYTIKKASSGGGGGGGGGGSTTKYTVTFDLNYEDATGAPESQSVKKGNKATQPADPAREGFVFLGWTENTETNTIFDFSRKISKKITLYAVWSEGYIVAFDLNCDDAINEPENQIVNVGGKAMLPEEPTRDGFTFTGWATTSTGETMWNFSHFVTDSMTLYAIWAAVTDISLDTPDPDIEIYSFDTDVYDVLIGTSEEITFTSEIFTNVELSDTDVSVVDETGTVLGYMNDEGIDGDEIADDGIYTLKKTLNADSTGNALYHVETSDVASDTVNIGFYREYTDEDMEIADGIVSKLRDASQPFINEDYTVEIEKVDELMEAISLCLDKEKENGIVAEYSVNFNSVKVVLSEGYMFEYSVEVAGISAGGDQVYVASYAPFDGIRRNPEEEALYDAALDGTAENIDSTFDKYVFRGNYNLNDVTLESLKHFSDYKVIIWGGHGGYDGDVGGYGSSLMTGQLVNRTTSNKYSADINAERILTRCMASGRNTYCVTGGFFEKYLGDMKDSFVYISACHSGQDMIDGIRHRYQLAQSFINKGARAVVGNSESIYTEYTYEMERDILNCMCTKKDDEYYTLSEALKYAKSLNGQNDGSERNARPMIFPQNDHKALNYRFEETGKGYISGKVMSADNSTDIANALVRVYQNNNLIESARTDSQGGYTVALPEGDYIVKITAGNYKSAKMAVTVLKDNTTYNDTFLLVQIGDEIGFANGVIRNALNAQAVSDVSIKIRSSMNNTTGSVIYTTTTNDVGYYEIEYIPGLYTMEFSKDGFITGYTNIVVGALGLFEQNAAISPVMSDENGEYRFILSWRNMPYDLDSHLTGPLEDSEDRFHLYYPLKDTNGASANPYREYATLDWDNMDITTNSDAETTTLHKQIDGVYRYSVHDYTNRGDQSSTDMANSNAVVNVYKGSVFIGAYYVPNIAGTIWTVFELSGDTFTTVNRVGNGYESDVELFGIDDEKISDEKMTDIKADDIEVSDTKADDVEVPNAEADGAEVTDIKEGDTEVPDAEIDDTEVSDEEEKEDTVVPDIEVPSTKVDDTEVPDAKTSDDKELSYDENIIISDITEKEQ